MISVGKELRQWYSVRGSLAEPDEAVESQIEKLERRRAQLLEKIKETA